MKTPKTIATIRDASIRKTKATASFAKAKAAKFHTNLLEKHVKEVHHYHRHLVILGCLFLCVSAAHVWMQTGDAIPNGLAILGTVTLTLADF